MKMRFVWIGIIIVLIGIIAQSIYKEATKTGAKSVRLACHKKSTVFEKVVAPEFVKELQENIKHSHLSIQIQAQKAQYGASELFEHVSVEDVLSMTKQELAKYQTDLKPMKKALIDVLVYENDINDPGKKNMEAKLYAGYLVYSFMLDDTLVYKIQVDFMNKQAKDVPDRIACAIESFMSL